MWFLIKLLFITSIIMVQNFNFHAAMSGKIVQHVLVAHCCQQDRHLSTQYRKDCCTPYRKNLLPCLVGKLAWNDVSTKPLSTFSNLNRAIVYCNGLFWLWLIYCFRLTLPGPDLSNVLIDLTISLCISCWSFVLFDNNLKLF